MHKQMLACVVADDLACQHCHWHSQRAYGDGFKRRWHPVMLVVVLKNTIWLGSSLRRSSGQALLQTSFLALVLGSSTEWMLGSTPPAAMVTPPSSLDSSSSLRTASWMWRGTMRVFLLSRAALPASSSTSAAHQNGYRMSVTMHFRSSLHSV